MRHISLLFAFVYSLVSASAQSYVFFRFDATGSFITTASGINNSGQIAGNFSDAAGYHPFVRTGAIYTTFEAPGAAQTVAAGINNLGQITGNYTDATGTHGYIRSADGRVFTTFDVPTPGAFTIPTAINDRGDVVGAAFVGQSAPDSFLRTTDGALTSIRFPGANSTTPTAITNAGDIVGTYINGGPLEDRHGFLRHADGTYVTIDVPGMESTAISAINNRGEVAGIVQNAHGFVRNASGAVTILDGFEAAQTLPTGINDNGELVGYTSANGISHGFLAIPGAGSTQPEIRPVRGVISASAFGGSDAIAPGTWIEVYGRNLAPAARQWSATDFNNGIAPVSLDGVSVMIDGRVAFVSYVSPGQINVQAPTTIRPGQVQVIVNNDGKVSRPYAVQVNSLQPGLLRIPGPTVALTYAAGLLPDQSFALPPEFGLSGPTRRARIGEIMTFYGIGFGPTVPEIAAGRIATGQAAVAARVEARLGGIPADVTYAGLVPGMVGLYQFNVVVPDDLSRASSSV
jgi:uncharacterized protein (TIGR03437 family)